MCLWWGLSKKQLHRCSSGTRSNKVFHSSDPTQPIFYTHSCICSTLTQYPIFKYLILKLTSGQKLQHCSLTARVWACASRPTVLLLEVPLWRKSTSFKQRRAMTPMPSDPALLILVFLWANLNPGLRCTYSSAPTGQREGGTSTTERPCDRGKTWWDLSVGMMNFSIFKGGRTVVSMNKSSTVSVRRPPRLCTISTFTACVEQWLLYKLISWWLPWCWEFLQPG